MSDPIITKRRIGDQNDPYVYIDALHVVNNDARVILAEVPDDFNKVLVYDGLTQLTEKDLRVETASEYQVSYSNGVVTFHSSKIGKQLRFVYYGTGLQYIPSTMIYTDINTNGDIVKTLRDYITNDVHQHNNKTQLDRMGVSVNGNLTIDGIEIVPTSTGGTGSTVTGSTTNGNIKVNGAELKVYNDTTVKSDITALKNDVSSLITDKHIHSNKAHLDRIAINPTGKLTVDGIEVSGSGSKVVDSVTNGNIKVDGTEMVVYDETAIKTDVADLKTNKHTHDNKASLDRIGLNVGNKFTVDSVELGLYKDIDDLKVQTHIHTNKIILDKIGISQDNQLTYEGIVVASGGGGSSVAKSNLNGNITVDGREIKVYDDNFVLIDVSQLKYDVSLNKADISVIKNETNINRVNITNLQNNLHSHLNKSSLDRLGVNLNGKLTIDGIPITTSGSGDTILDSDINGNLRVNGTELKVYDDTQIMQLIRNIQGGGAMLVVKEYFEGNTNITKSFSEDMDGLTISNDGATDMTVVINEITIPVKAGEVFDETFEPFTEVTINTSGSYRAYVKQKVEQRATDIVPPDNVGSVNISNITYNSVTISWSSSLSPDVVAYKVYVNGSQTAVAILEKTKLNYKITGLEDATFYTFRVTAVDSSGNESSGTSATATTNVDTGDYVAPPNPVMSTATNVTEEGFTLNWNPVTASDLAGYNIYDGSLNRLNNTLITTTNYTISGLQTNTPYTYKITSVDTNGNESSGTTVTQRTSPDVTPPANVSNLTIGDATLTSLKLTWIASISTDVQEYLIYQGTNTTPIGTTTSTNYTVTGLNNSTSYTFKVKVKDTSGNISTGIEVTGSTAVPDTISPENVTNVNHSNLTDRSLTLSWTASTSTDIAGYEVHKNSELLQTVTGLTHSITGLTPSTSYTFTIKAKDHSGNIASGTQYNITTLADTTAPDNVTNLQETNLKDTSLTLTWTASIASDVQGYNIYKDGVKINSSAVTATTYNVTGLTKSTTYNFTVKATDGVNESSGTSKSVTTESDLPPIIYDSFDRADTTSLTTTESGHTWLHSQYATYGISGNQAKQTSFTTGGVRVRRPSYVTLPNGMTFATHNIAVEMTLPVIDAINGGTPTIHFRFGDTMNTTYLTCTTKVFLYKMNQAETGSGSLSAIQINIGNISDGQKVRAESYTDGTIKVYIDGILQYTGVDTSNLTYNKVGFASEKDTVRLDDFKVYAI